MKPIVLDPDDAVPPFEQIRVQLAAAIDGGELAPETRLPTVRQLAADLGLAVNTVARTYRELELAGLIETRGRRGTFVSGGASRPRELSVQAAREYVRTVESLGLGHAEALAIVRREIEARSVATTGRTRP